jgi:CRP/FNR family transcriptional regulator, cyclic AMP receptor protein
MTWVEAIGYGGTCATVCTYAMRTIIPLRIAGIASSFFFITYALFISSWPMLATELVILPLNCVRLYQLLKLMRQVDEATGNELSVDWLESFTRDRAHTAGDVLFRAGDKADYLLVVRSGRFRLAERNIDILPGALVGELGFLSPNNLRTMTLECVVPGSIGRISYEDLKQLYFQNPKFGFYLLRLMATRLFDNLDHARATAQAPEPLPLPLAFTATEAPATVH